MVAEQPLFSGEKKFDKKDGIELSPKYKYQTRAFCEKEMETWNSKSQSLPILLVLEAFKHTLDERTPTGNCR